MGSGGSLAGRVAVVTGAGRGIGRAHAITLAALGAAVVVNDLGTGLDGSGEDTGVAEAVIAEICTRSGRAIGDATDISSFAGGSALVERALTAFGRLDILINNAGIGADAPLDELDEETVLRLLRVHHIGTLATAKAALPIMRAQGHGRIVNTVSEAALDPRHPGGIAYGGAKAAVWAATLAMARETEGSGVTVNAISPGARTRMNDALFAALGEPALDLDPFHVARVVAALVADDAGHLNGRIVHAAAGQVREYLVRRTADGDAVAFLTAASTSAPGP